MRRIRIPVLSVVCAGLLATQLTGLHMHVDAHGYAGIPVGMHVHRTAADADHYALVEHVEEADHDHHAGDLKHDGDRDVSVIELGAGVLKLLVFLAFVALGLVIILRRGIRIRRPTPTPHPRPRHERWRPPLRAPPVFFLHSSYYTR